LPTGIDAEVDQIAVARCAHQPGKYAHGLRTIRARAPDHLICHSVKAVVAAMALRHAIACVAGERRTGRIEPEVRRRVVPEAELVDARQTSRVRRRRIGRGRVERVLRFANEEGTGLVLALAALYRPINVTHVVTRERAAMGQANRNREPATNEAR
jgi:hypothetical protein